MPFGQRHVAINIYNICKGHFGSRGGGDHLKSVLKNLKYIICVHFGKFVKLSIIFWTAYLEDLAQI